MLCREVFFSQMLTGVCCNPCPHFHDLVLGLGVEFGFGGWRTFCEVFLAFRVGGLVASLLFLWFCWGLGFGWPRFTFCVGLLVRARFA